MARMLNESIDSNPPLKKSGFVALIGRPSVGKSALLNALVGYKTAIVSPLPQTTRSAIRGIMNTDLGQIVFVDSPGLHQSEKKFNGYMEAQSKSAITDCDLILYLCDLSRRPGDEEEAVAKLIIQSGKPVIIALNKCDIRNRELFGTNYHRFFAHFFPTSEIIIISAEQNINLDTLKRSLYKNLSDGPLMYDSELYTDQSPSFRIAEVVREKAISCLHQELPHSIYVDVADIEMHGKTLWARCFIMVERESQKGIVVGKGGKTLHQIRENSMKELRKIFPYPLKLDFMVKVDEHWRKNDQRLKSLFTPL